MNGAALLAAFVAALAAIEVIRRSALARILADRPNERSLHIVPTPRVGGLGLLAGALPVAFAFATPVGEALAALAAALAVVSALDDARSLPVALRLACHFAAAAAVVFLAPPVAAPMTAWAVGLVVVLAMAWMTNLFNFMDGSDGLAGGMAAVGFGTLAVAAHRAGGDDIAMFAGATSVASVAFLAFNFPPAKVFLGDAGAVPLGFVAGALGWQGIARGLWPAWFPVLVFSPFVVDATVTLLRRLAAGERVWRAHRGHYYQRLILGGWSHRRLALHAWALMAAAGASAAVAREGPELLQSGILAAWVVAYAGLAILIDRGHPRGPS